MSVSRNEWFLPKWKWLKRFALVAVPGAVLLGFGFAKFDGLLGGALFVLGFLMCVPLVFWLILLPVLHWRERYKGTHPNIWGAFLVLETSGWTKIIYWFVHVLPDWKQRGIYQDVA